MLTRILDILFPSNHNIYKSLYGLCFWASVPLIDRFYWILSIKGFEAQKPKPHELFWMLWVHEKVYPVPQTVMFTPHNGKENKFIVKCILAAKMLAWCRHHITPLNVYILNIYNSEMKKFYLSYQTKCF